MNKDNLRPVSSIKHDDKRAAIPDSAHQGEEQMAISGAPEWSQYQVFRHEFQRGRDPELYWLGKYRNDEEDELERLAGYYKHSDNWQNRLIQGDSLLVMNSLLNREGMKGQVQCIYFDPPYGIRYGGNWQIMINKPKMAHESKDAELSSEPEMIKAYRDTWELGIHSYLSYLRDRLVMARELLKESGSCFVQISA